VRLSLVIEGLGPGGAQRVLSFLASTWAARGDHVDLLVLGPGGEQPFHPLGQGVAARYLSLPGESRGLGEALVNNGLRVGRLRRALRGAKPALVLSFCDTTNVLTLIAGRGLRAPVVVAERTDPRRHPIGLPWTLLRRVTYRWADAVVVQSRLFVDAFPARVRRRTVVVPNPVVPATGRPDRPREGRCRVVALGRLGREKGFDVLLEAFSRVAPLYPDWSLTVHGEGVERASLEARTRALGLTDRVEFPGITRDSEAALGDADLFVLPSRYEGFPNALCEAMAAGLAVVATDSGGTRDIVRSGVDGLLVPVDNSELLAQAMARLMSDSALRAGLGSRAREVAERFAPETVGREWDALFARLLGDHAP